MSFVLQYKIVSPLLLFPKISPSKGQNKKYFTKESKKDALKSSKPLIERLTRYTQSQHFSMLDVGWNLNIEEKLGLNSRADNSIMRSILVVFHINSSKQVHENQHLLHFHIFCLLSMLVMQVLFFCPGKQCCIMIFYHYVCL